MLREALRAATRARALVGAESVVRRGSGVAPLRREARRPIEANQSNPTAGIATLSQLRSPPERSRDPMMKAIITATMPQMMKSVRPAGRALLAAIGSRAVSGPRARWRSASRAPTANMPAVMAQWSGCVGPPRVGTKPSSMMPGAAKGAALRGGTEADNRFRR